MAKKRQVSYKDGLVTFEQTSFKVHGLDKLQSAIESITDRNDTVLVELNMQELLNLRRLLVQDMVSNVVTSDDFKTKVDLSKASRESKSSNVSKDTPNHTTTRYADGVLAMGYVLDGVIYSELEALEFLIKNNIMSKLKAELYLRNLPHRA